ncbi:MAG: DUF5686 family protein [Candidatus Kapabacteria bacterium]|nr:DUF5686 family protein [Candidatus Kapabacteria bacterium]
MKRNKLYFILILLILISISNLKSQNVIFGKVIDELNNKAIPGATIKLLNTKKGTYTNNKGYFRLPSLESNSRIKISSLGYEPKEISIIKFSDTLFIRLKEDALIMKEALVIGNIEPELVIKRAIEKKEENNKKLKTFSGLLYSKLFLEIDGNLLENAQTTSNSISLTMGNKQSNENVDKYKLWVVETFSNIAKDYEKNVNFTEIIQRRQTANMQPQDNLISISNFQNFYDDEVKIADAHIITPLSKDALSYYNFKIIKKIKQDNRYIYVMKVEPKSNTYPSFYGTIQIVEGTYSLVDLDLTPSESSAIQFFKKLTYKEKFEEIEGGIWYPSYMDMTANVNINIISGLAEFEAKFNVNSIYSQVKVNEQLPDSIYTKINNSIKVAKMADSNKIEFWEKNSLREISEKELQVYNKIDSLVKSDTSKKEDRKAGNNMSIGPYLDYNRVMKLNFGITLGYSPINNLVLNGKAYYTLGQKILYDNKEINTLGSLGLEYNILNNKGDKLYLKSNAFSQEEKFGSDRSIPNIANMLFAGIFHTDYYDYYRKDGYSISLDGKLSKIDFSINYEESRHKKLRNSTDYSIFNSDNFTAWLENRNIVPATYKVLTFKSEANILKGLDYSLLANIGQSEFVQFNSIQGSLKLSIPTFYTGYNPMNLELLLSGGVGTNNLPLEYQFRMQTRSLFYSPFGSFSTAKIGEYGGNKFLTAHLNYNTGDLWWRAIGLPLYNGRGLELNLGGASGYFLNEAGGYTQVRPYEQTPNTLYSEVGFGLGRIPTFISNLVYWETNFRFGVGNLAQGRFGWDLKINFPF